MKRITFLIILSLNLSYLYPHHGYQEHCEEMIRVFGFVPSPEINAWAKFISSDMIDKCEPFYGNLKARHPKFQCKHRLLFHWGYNSEPWNSALERKVREYCRLVNAINVNDTISCFKREFKEEQKRRNYEINKRTEELFGFAHGGTDAMFANRFASMAYNIHLLGDYTSDNKDLEGVLDINRLIGAIVTDIKTLDQREGKILIGGITQINNQIGDTQKKADALMKYLLTEFPPFIKRIRGGSVYRRLKYQNINFY